MQNSHAAFAIAKTTHSPPPPPEEYQGLVSWSQDLDEDHVLWRLPLCPQLKSDLHSDSSTPIRDWRGKTTMNDVDTNKVDDNAAVDNDRLKTLKSSSTTTTNDSQKQPPQSKDIGTLYYDCKH